LRNNFRKFQKIPIDFLKRIAYNIYTG
jgi:hypothetical protein